MLHALVQFFGSLAWWEWLIGIPAFICVGILAFVLALNGLVLFVFEFFTNQRFASIVGTAGIVGSIAALIVIIARHV